MSFTKEALKACGLMALPSVGASLLDSHFTLVAFELCMCMPPVTVTPAILSVRASLLYHVYAISTWMADITAVQWLTSTAKTSDMQADMLWQTEPDTQVVMGTRTNSVPKLTHLPCYEKLGHLLPYILPCRFDGDIRSSEGVKLVDEYHNKYIAALTELWETNKLKYADPSTADLKLVE